MTDLKEYLTLLLVGINSIIKLIIAKKNLLWILICFLNAL